MRLFTIKRLAASLLALAAIVGMLTVGTHALFTDSTANTGNDVDTGELTAPSLSQPTPSGGSVPLSWTAATLPGNASHEDDITYTVERKLGSGSYGSAGGTCTGSLSATSCTDSLSTSGTYTYRVIAHFRSWTTPSNERSVTVALGAAPAAPTTVALANGGGVGNAYINNANKGSLNVSVGLPASSVSTNTVHVTITDGTNTTTDQTTAATNGAGTVTVTGINATSLNDGSVTIQATSSNGSGTSPQTTTSVTKDTVTPTSQVEPVTSITSGNTFTVPYTSGDASPSSSLEKVELYVDTPGAPATFALTNTDSDPSASGESFSYTGATTDGTYGFYTRAYDNAGNVEDAPGAADQTATRTTVTPFRMATGTYTGNGVDNRAIAGLGFQPDVVIVKGASQISVMRTSSMPTSGNNTKPLTGNTALATGVRSLTSDGFTLATGNQVNASGTTYHWTAYKAADGVLKVGTYTGNGSSPRSITGAGFQPEYAAVLPANNTPALQRFAGMSAGFLFINSAGNANRITALGADGFTVGAEGNANTVVYHYILFNEVAGAVDTGSYAASGSSQNITSVGFQPDHVMIKGDAAVNGIHRPASLSGTGSFLFTNAANVASGITALTATGFNVGNDAAVNTTGNYYYLALKNTAGGSSQFTTLSGTNAGDSWVNQASPSANLGGDSVLKVTSKNGSSNTRAFVKFNLPAAPGGFTFKHSGLYLRDTSSASGRTIQAFRAGECLPANVPPCVSPWTEGGVTWANQPPAAGTAATAVTVNADGYLGWTVSSLVDAMYSGSNFGFLLRDQTEDDSGGQEQQFTSEEGSSDQIPRLDVTFGN